MLGPNETIAILVLIFALLTIYKGAKVVPQSEQYVVERFGKFRCTLNAGLNFIIPYLDSVAHRISILERQLPEFRISVITRDNVEVQLEATVFYRIEDPAKSVYRIRDVDLGLNTNATSVVRSAAGRLELDELQSSRDSMNAEIQTNLQKPADDWGIKITRTEITDVIIDEATREAQRQQLNAERERRAVIARAEGEKRSVELAAEAKLFEAEKEAEAIKVNADATAYSVQVKAKADAEQTRLLAAAIEDNGQPAINFEVMKRQVEAMSEIASSRNSKTIIMPTEIVKAIGSLEVLLGSFNRSNDGGDEPPAGPWDKSK